MSNDITLGYSLSSDELRKHVSDCASRFGVRDFVLGIWRNADVKFLSSGPTADCSDLKGNTTVQIGCVTKLLTARLVHELIDSGAAALDSKLNEFITPITPEETDLFSSVTLQDLLLHTHGLDSSYVHRCGPGGTLISTDLERQRPLVSLYRPGALVAHSYIGYKILGRIAERGFGITYEELIRIKILEPLKRSLATSFSEGKGLGGDPQRSRPSSVFNSSMTCNELLLWIKDFLPNRPYSRMIATMRLSPAGALGSDAVTIGGMVRYGPEEFGYAGTGDGMHHVISRIVPAENMAVVLMASIFPAQRFFYELFPSLMERRASHSSSEVGKPRRFADEELVGCYSNSYGSIRIISKNGKESWGRVEMAYWTASGGTFLETEIHLRFVGGRQFAVVSEHPCVRHPFLWFLSLTSQDKPEYLWNEEFIWKRS